MWNRMVAAILILGVIGATAAVAWSDENEASTAALAKYLPGAKVTLQQGLAAAESKGTPISGKYEVEEGHLQLSVYTAQDGKFSEVVVDHNTGKVAKAEPITEGDDLADARKQAQVCAKATKPLKSAVDQAEQASPGYRAVSVIPKVSGGRTVAVVTFVKGTSAKSVSEPLQ